MVSRCGRAHVVAIATLLACASESPSGDDGSSGASDTGTSSSAGDTTTSSTTAATSFTTTSATSLTTSSGDDESSTGAPIDGYPCSVQVVTEGAIYDPLVRGDGPGVFPPIVADALEDACGCHTLTGGAQNLHWPELQAPGGTNILQYGDLMNGFEGGTLGQAIESEVRGFRMPVGSCPKPMEIAEVLVPWFDQGMPDGATFVP